MIIVNKQRCTLIMFVIYTVLHKKTEPFYFRLQKNRPLGTVTNLGSQIGL